MPAEPQPDAVTRPLPPPDSVTAPLLPRTEMRNDRTTEIDTVGTLELLRLLNAEDAVVAGAVAVILPTLAEVVDLAVARVRDGGHVHYFGAGSSGRIGVLDAAEVVPTFGVDASLFVAHHAGGESAMAYAIEGAEDRESLGRQASRGGDRGRRGGRPVGQRTDPLCRRGAARSAVLDEGRRGQQRLDALRRIGDSVDEAGLYEQTLIPDQQ